MTGERQSGRTTRQIEQAPARAIFVCPTRAIDYTKALAHYLGRPDLKIVGPYFFSAAQGVVGRDASNTTGVIVDHATLDSLHHDQRQACLDSLERLQKKGIPTI